jgi:hypothetical protein
LGVPNLFHKASELCHVRDDDKDHRCRPDLKKRPLDLMLRVIRKFIPVDGKVMLD